MSDTENHECADRIEIKADNDFDDLIGQEFDFYGVDGNCFKLDDVVYEAVEDEDDGWRSMLGCVEVRERIENKIFFRMPVARVVIEHEGNSRKGIYKLTDLHDGHEWLRFGTDDYDDWYPRFVFEYSPKETGEQ